MTHHDYESWGASSLKDFILEAYTGTDIVGWYGNIERQLVNMVEQYEAGRNFNYADKLRAFLNEWRKYQLTGSINRETLDPLEATANILASDSWKLSNYFSNLRDQLRKLAASEEELPRMEEPEKVNKRERASIRPPGGDFGGEKTAAPAPAGGPAEIPPAGAVGAAPGGGPGVPPTV